MNVIDQIRQDAKDKGFDLLIPIIDVSYACGGMDQGTLIVNKLKMTLELLDPSMSDASRIQWLHKGINDVLTELTAFGKEQQENLNKHKKQLGFI